MMHPPNALKATKGAKHMKKIYPTMTILSIFFLFAAMAIALPAQAQSAPDQNKEAMQVFQGELTRVDANAKTLWVKGAEGKEMDFQYNEQTQIIGAEGGVEGLATQSGAPVAVHFDKKTKTAYTIEVQKREK
jgi:hypothetical protein